MNHGRRPRAATRIGQGTACLAVAGLLAATIARAQDGGLVATIDVSAGIRLEDGTGNDSSSGGGDATSGSGLDSRIGFGLISTTSTQRLAFRFDENIVTDQGDGLKLRPSASLDYRRLGKASELNFNLDYRQEEVEGSDLIPDDFFGGELVADSGIRRTVSGDFSLVTGTGRPFGTETVLSYTKRSYTETADPDLIDTDSKSASETLRFTLSPVVTLRLTGSYEDRQIGGLEDRDEKTTRVGVGADLTPNAVWQVSTDIGFAQVETDEADGLGGRVTTTDRGGEASLSATRTLENGTLSLSAAHELSPSGARTTVSVGRSLTLPAATLDGSVGLVRFEESGDVAPLFTLAYDQDLPRGATFNLSLSQVATTDLQDESVVRSQFAASYTRPLTAVSSWSVNTSLARITVIGGGEDDRTLASLGLNYQRELNADWDLSVGVRVNRGYTEGDLTTRTNVLTASVQRRFTFRP